jgi:hypothetical protein
MQSARRFNEVVKGSLIGNREFKEIEVLNIDVDDKLQMLSHEAFMNGLLRQTGVMADSHLESTAQIN